MVNREEFAEQLNQYAKEIYEAIRDEEDEITGKRNFNPIMRGFFTDRAQLTTFIAFFDMSTHLSVDMCEPLSKKLVATRMLISLFDMSDLLKKHTEKLEEYLKPEENRYE